MWRFWSLKFREGKSSWRAKFRRAMFRKGNVPEGQSSVHRFAAMYLPQWKWLTQVIYVLWQDSGITVHITSLRVPRLMLSHLTMGVLVTLVCWGRHRLCAMTVLGDDGTKLSIKTISVSTHPCLAEIMLSKMTSVLRKSLDICTAYAHLAKNLCMCTY